MPDRKVEDLKILFSQKELEERIKQLAEAINKDFGTKEDLTLICVLKGSSIFCCDLCKHLKMPVQMEFIRVSSYGNAKTSSGHVQALDLTLPNLENKNALIIEDIIDTGCTMQFLMDILCRTHKPKNLKVVTLLNKKMARKVPIEPDYYGFEIDDKFVVGYGLDYEGYMRNLPYIGYFEN
ncbi:MAG: hypoxanthine phosphoribosyltransferase [Clostridium sp.]|nr:hypoxanthine phosphoribosyltransferase [Clostridium sp.]